MYTLYYLNMSQSRQSSFVPLHHISSCWDGLEVWLFNTHFQLMQLSPEVLQLACELIYLGSQRRHLLFKTRLISCFGSSHLRRINGVRRTLHRLDGLAYRRVLCCSAGEGEAKKERRRGVRGYYR